MKRKSNNFSPSHVSLFSFSFSLHRMWTINTSKIITTISPLLIFNAGFVERRSSFYCFYFCYLNVLNPSQIRNKNLFEQWPKQHRPVEIHTHKPVCRKSVIKTKLNTATVNKQNGRVQEREYSLYLYIATFKYEQNTV